MTGLVVRPFTFAARLQVDGPKALPAKHSSTDFDLPATQLFTMARMPKGTVCVTWPVPGIVARAQAGMQAPDQRGGVPSPGGRSRPLLCVNPGLEASFRKAWALQKAK